MALHKLKESIIKEINDIPEDQLQELHRLIHSYKQSRQKTQDNETLQQLLLRAPVWGDVEIDAIRQLRSEMNQWPIQSF
jgi:hypothetical protein